MPTPQTTSLSLPFRPRARLLQLLGEELIGTPRLAVFELVKNAYDACASEVEVRFEGLDTDDPVISVRDNGEGMTLETIRDIWMVPAHDHRKRQRTKGVRSECGRLPLGEKGVGRFAAHKLGDRIELTTRSSRKKECYVEIDWEEFFRAEYRGSVEVPKYLDDVEVQVKGRPPQTFTKERTGTLIRVRKLKPADYWSRGEIRRLHRQITAICSPFDAPSDFSVALTVPGFEHWIEDIPDVEAILRAAFWNFEFSFDGERFDWSYHFRPASLKLTGRKCKRSEDTLLIPEAKNGKGGAIWKGRRKDSVMATEATIKGIGPIKGRLYVYDRDDEVLERLPESNLLTTYLDRNGGVRVYRDGMRVYNYGEPGDDWLSLDLRRVNVPAKRLSRNLILGAIHVSLEESTGLIEKTNREGFVENDALSRLRRLVLGVLAALEAERNIDKERIRKLLSKSNVGDEPGPLMPLRELEKELRRAKLYPRFEKHVESIRSRYEEMQESLLQPAMAGLNLSLVFHEVERGVRELLGSVKRRENLDQLEAQALHLAQLLDEFSLMLRRHRRQKNKVSRVVEQALGINATRFKVHGVDVQDAVSASEDSFTASFAFNLVLGAVNNLIDNAIYWLRVRWPDPEETSRGRKKRRLYIGTSRELEGGPCLIVADNGPGFRNDSPELLMRPFFTRKPEGMGLGLYYANLVMELSGGRLVFPGRGDIDLPKGIDGAVVALQFVESK